jgi:integrase/recombinase XerD
MYDYGRRLEAARKRISSLANSRLLLAFLDHLKALGLSDGRVAKYANHICALTRGSPFNPKTATREEIERVIAWINSQPYKSTTKKDLKIVVKRLVQYARHGSCATKTPIPDEVKWFSINTREKDSRVGPEMLLTLEEVKAMIGTAENERDKALVSVLFEAALRPGELLGMTVGSVEFRDSYCLITVKGKTGIKRLPLVASHKSLLDWLMRHPKRNDPEAPLWISLSNNSKAEGMSYYYLRKLVKQLAAKAGVKKKVWPYLFRHSCLTAMAKILTEAKLELYAGWVHGSDMPRRYVHFSARDLEETILEVHGLRRAERAEGIIKPAECPRCGKRNSPDSVRCSFCGYILDKKLAAEMEEKERERNMEIVQRIERLEGLVKALINGGAHS